MTDTQRKAVSLVIRMYVEFSDEYKLRYILDNDHISAALKKLFAENIITAEELSQEIKDFTYVDVSARTLKRAADGIFISITNGGGNCHGEKFNFRHDQRRNNIESPSPKPGASDLQIQTGIIQSGSMERSSEQEKIRK